GQVERRDDGLEVVAVGAEAVQPDDARLRVVPRLDLERVEEVGHRSTWGAPTWPPPPPPARSAPGNPWRSSPTRAWLPIGLAARRDPRLRPREAGARPLAVAAHLGPGPPRGDTTVQLHLRRLRREERAEDADRTVVGAWGQREHEGLDAVPPGHPDPVGRRDDGFDRGRVRIAAPCELGTEDRQVRIGERREEQRLDRALEPARDGSVVGIDAHLALGERTLDEERVAAAGGAPEHAPVAQAVRLGLAAVGAQADERVLAGHEDVGRVHGGWHGQDPTIPSRPSNEHFARRLRR